MKVTGLVLTSFAALAAAQGPTDAAAPAAGEPGGAPVVAVSPAGAGPSAGQPVPPNPAPYAGAAVPVVGQAPQKCAVSCAISGLTNNNCNTLAAAPKGLPALPKGARPPPGAVSRSVYEAVIALQDSQLPQSLPAPPAGGAALITFSQETRTCLCSGRNGRKLRAGGAKCKASGGAGCKIRDSPISPRALVDSFLNQLCAGVPGWKPVGPRPKGQKGPKGPKGPKQPKGLGYPPALNGGAAPGPAGPVAPAGPAVVAPAAAAPAPVAPAPAALAPSAVPVAPTSGAEVAPAPVAAAPAAAAPAPAVVA